MSEIIRLIVILWLSFIPAIGITQENPFLTPAYEDSESQIETGVSEVENTLADTIKSPGLGRQLLAFSSSVQQNIKSALTGLSKTFKEEQGLRAVILMFLLAFIYGVVHALGPGHGKVFALSYFIAEEAEYKKGMALGLMVAVLHAFSAIVLITILKLVLGHSLLVSSESATTVLRKISFAIIALMGIYLFVSHYLHHHKKNKSENVPVKRNAFLMALSIGIVPCSGSIIILLFFLSVDLYTLGILLVISMTFGMALTITGVGIVTILARKGVLKAFGDSFKLNKIEKIFEYTGSVLVFLFGLVFFLSV